MQQTARQVLLYEFLEIGLIHSKNNENSLKNKCKNQNNLCHYVTSSNINKELKF